MTTPFDCDTCSNTPERPLSSARQEQAQPQRRTNSGTVPDTTGRNRRRSRRPRQPRRTGALFKDTVGRDHRTAEPTGSRLRRCGPRYPVGHHRDRPASTNNIAGKNRDRRLAAPWFHGPPLVLPALPAPCSASLCRISKPQQPGTNAAL